MQRTRTTPKPNLIVSQGDGWRVEYDRTTKDYVAIVDGAGYLGSAAKPHEAQALITAYRAGQLKQAA